MKRYTLEESRVMQDKIIKILVNMKKKRTVDCFFRAKTLSKKTGFTGQAVSVILSRLIKKGFIVEVGRNTHGIKYKTTVKLKTC